MFDQQISIFENVYSDPKPYTLRQWLKLCIRGSRFAGQVQQYRKEYDKLERRGLTVEQIKDELKRTGIDKRLKKSLPVATVGAVLTGKKDAEKYPKLGTGYRVEEQIALRTGWIALDVDAKDNPHIKDASHLRNEIAKIIYVAYAGLSVSGKGVWALVKVKHPDKQAEYFQQLINDFERRRIILDSSKGENSHDARYYSYDPDGYSTKNFKVYERLPITDKQQVTNKIYSFDQLTYNPNDTRSKVEQLIQQIQSQRIDITKGYKNWLNIGFALEDEFGEVGQDYFHAVSQYHSGYDEREADRQYTHCLKARGSGVTIASFFHVCKEYGITLNAGRGKHAPAVERNSNGKYEPQKNVNCQKNLDSLPYPADWDEITLDKNSEEAAEAERYALNDADTEFQRLQIKDPVVKQLVDMFDGQIMPGSNIELLSN